MMFKKDTTDYIKTYHDEVERGNIVVSKKIQQQIDRVKGILENEAYIFDVALANKPINFANLFCKHFEGKFAGKPMEFELWQKYIISVMYGIIYKDTKLRVSRQAMVLVGRKNGKSTMIAVLALYNLIADGENAPQVYTIANKLQQANVIFNQCNRMVQMHPKISEMLTKRRTDIEFKAMNGVLSPLASDSNKLDGLNPSFSAFDELHAFKDQNLISVIQSGQGAREQPLMFMITTNGNTRGKVFDHRYQYFTDILNGDVNDDSVQPFLFELDNSEEINMPEAWIKANPNLGVSLSIPYIKDQVKIAKDDPIQINDVLCKHFNLAVASSAVFFTNEECQANKYDEEKYLLGSTGVLGIDMSYTSDFTAVTYLTEAEDGKVYSKVWLFKPEELLTEHSLVDKLDYNYFKKIGAIETLKGSRIEQRQIIEFIATVVDKLDLSILKVGVDPYHAEGILDYYRDNYYPDFAVAVHNGYFKAVTPTIYKLKNLLVDHLLFFNNELLTIHLAGCVAEEKKDGTITLHKVKSRHRIDGAWSTIYALKALELSKKDGGEF